MSSTTGNIIKVSIFGESHSAAIGMTVNGLPAGIRLNYDLINKRLEQRKSLDEISTPRREKDDVIFLSGVFNDFTTGSPLTFIIENKDIVSKDYLEGLIRPSHSDLTTYLKYQGAFDYRGGGFSSGRITASLVVLGAICEDILSKKGIKIATHISNIKMAKDRDFDFKNIDLDIETLNNKKFAVLDDFIGQEMIKLISNIKDQKDSIGGSLETIVIGVEPGLGEPYFDSVESTISKLLFSIGGIKGVLFGDGSDFAYSLGSEVKDELKYNSKGEIEYLANHNGGINGGITNGKPIIVKSIVKPTPSIGLKQQTINVKDKINVSMELKGRFDPCIVHRVLSVQNAVIAYAILDLLLENNAHKIC